MSDIKNFKLRDNRIDFELDGEKFTAKYPEKYSFGREYLDLAKEFALCQWANKVAFEQPAATYLDFGVDERSIEFWLWVAQKVHELDVYQSLSDEFESDPKPMFNLRDSVTVETGSDPSGLIDSTPSLPDQEYDGALISQSPGKESVATKLICDEAGIPEERQLSVFIEYSSRAATHKIDGREEYTSYFENPTERIWSNFNELQTTIQEYTENYEPITCFWEMAYLTMELPMAVENGLKYMLMGNQLNTGEAMHDPQGRFVTFEELNQSCIFELAYTDYLNRVHDLPVVHTSVVRPFTGYSCRKIIGREEPDFLPIMQNCLRPNSKRRWCLKCYKCNNSWVEFLACGLNPAEAGLDHDVLIENPHFAADNEDWGFSFPRYARDEQVWVDEGAEELFEEHVRDELTEEQEGAFGRWRSRQVERVDWEEVDHLRKFNGQFIEPVTGVVPDELAFDMGLEHTDFVPELLDVRDYRHYSKQWRETIESEVER